MSSKPWLRPISFNSSRSKIPKAIKNTSKGYLPQQPATTAMKPSGTPMNSNYSHGFQYVTQQPITEKSPNLYTRPHEDPPRSAVPLRCLPPQDALFPRVPAPGTPQKRPQEGAMDAIGNRSPSRNHQVSPSPCREERFRGKWSDISFALYERSGKKIFRSSHKCREKWFNHLNPVVNH